MTRAAAKTGGPGQVWSHAGIVSFGSSAGCEVRELIHKERTTSDFFGHEPLPDEPDPCGHFVTKHSHTIKV